MDISRRERWERARRDTSGFSDTRRDLTSALVGLVLSVVGLVAFGSVHAIRDDVIIVIASVVGAVVVVPVGELAYNWVKAPRRILSERVGVVEAERDELVRRRSEAQTAIDARLVDANSLRSFPHARGENATFTLSQETDKWITATKVLLEELAPQEVVFFITDTGDYGSGVWAVDSQLEHMDAMRTRQLERLDRHILRLQEIRKRA